jgi:hypothetical protein
MRIGASGSAAKAQRPDEREEKNVAAAHHARNRRRASSDCMCDRNHSAAGPHGVKMPQIQYWRGSPGGLRIKVRSATSCLGEEGEVSSVPTSNNLMTGIGRLEPI